MSFKLTAKASVAAVETQASDTLGPPSTVPHVIEHELQFPNGNAAGQTDVVWSDSRVINAGVVDALELDNLPANGPNPARTPAKVKGFFIKNRSASGYITIGGGSGGSTAPNADSWSGTDAGVVGSPFNVDGSFIRLAAGDSLFWQAKAGVSVVNATADKLGLEAFVAQQTIDICVWGDD